MNGTDIKNENPASESNWAQLAGYYKAEYYHSESKKEDFKFQRDYWKTFAIFSIIINGMVFGAMIGKIIFQ